MIETRAAILALMLLALLTFQFKRNVADERMNMIRGEIQLIASGVGVDHLDAIGIMDFDDIKNLNGAQQMAQVVLGTDTLSFDLVTSVHFLDWQSDSFVPTASVTNYQEVTVSIDGLLESDVTMSRIYSRASN